MKIYLMYGIIVLITIIFFVLIKDKIKALRLTGILTILSSVLLIILIFITRLIVNTKITSINISLVTNYLFMKFATTSLILFIIGTIEILISKYLYSKKKIKA